MFIFDPKTDEEIAEMQNVRLLKEGNYLFTVIGYEEKVSQANNPMIKVILTIFNPINKQDHIIIDYLLATGKMIYKFKHFCDAMNCQNEYAAGKIDPKLFVGRKGCAILAIEKGEAKPDGSGYYPDKNFIKDYLRLEENKISPKEFKDSDIPF